MSKQSEWQKKMVEQGRCVICGKPADSSNKRFCEFHRLQVNKRQNERKRLRKQESID